jgi:hypothetical protein
MYLSDGTVDEVDLATRQTTGLRASGRRSDFSFLLRKLNAMALAVATRLSSSLATPHPEPPMPIAFTDEEMSLLINLSGPIAPAARPAFLDAVAAELEAKGQPRGVGIVYQVGRVVQRQFWDPPQISPNASAPVHRGSAA